MGIVDDFKLSIFVGRYGERIADIIKEVLNGLGEETIRKLVDSDKSLWAIWPEHKGDGDEDLSKDRIFAEALPYRNEIGHMTLADVADELLRLIKEKAPNFAFIPQPWMLKLLREMRVDIMKHTVE